MTVRLFVSTSLKTGEVVVLSDNAYHYLVHVMRANIGDKVLLFNGIDGEWEAQIDKISKKEIFLKVIDNVRLQSEEELSDVYLCFAPIKKDNMDFVIQKATELGVSVLQPVVTRRTVVGHFNTQKMRLQAIEAAEQCERLSVPEIKEAISLDDLLENWDENRILYYLNERGEGIELKKCEKTAYLVGPEGGFDVEEVKKLEAFQFAHSVHLGRRILRAETACVAILAIHNQLHAWK